MILVDKIIKEKSKEIFAEGYKAENVNCISYDLTIECIIDSKGNERKTYETKPGDVVYIKTCERLSMPSNMIGRIEEKNSRMRQGLMVTGPTYQPGHITNCFLRVQNISEMYIELSIGMKIAQVVFETLDDEPEVTYDKQNGASFNSETEYRGLGNYKEEYSKQTKKYIEEKEKNIEELSSKIYANVLETVKNFV